MKALYKKESNFSNHGNTHKPLIEVIEIRNFEKKELLIENNEIVFFVEGRMKYVFNDFVEYEAAKGEVLFLPAGERYYYETQTNVTLIVVRLFKSMNLCNTFSLEKLNSPKSYDNDDFCPRTKNWFSISEIHPRIWQFLDGIQDCMSDGLKEQDYFEMKTRELFYLLNAYCTKEDLCKFFFFILNEDSAFSEYVHLCWQSFGNVSRIAKSMHLTHKQFSKRFVSVFGKTPQKWMMEAKADIIYNKIIQTNKPFKLIATENGLSSDTHFTWFCRKNFGKTPSEIRKKAKI